jgi:DNA-binding transcriptional LysR family regulator
VLARADEAEHVLSEFGKLKGGTLAVQASQTIAGYWLPRHLVAYRWAYPEIEIRLAIGNTTQVAGAVESGTAELGFVEGVVENQHFASTPVARDQLVVVVGPSHPWAGRARLDPRDLIEGGWVLREPGSCARSDFEDALAGFGVEPRHLRIHLELPSNEAVRAAVEAGLGATALSASVAAPSLEAGLLHQVDFRLPERAFHVLHHRERYCSRAADALLALIAKSRADPTRSKR